MSFNHERQDGGSPSEEGSSGLGLVGMVVGGGLVAVLAACVVYMLAGAAIAIGTLAFKGLIALSIAIAVVSALLASATVVQESFSGTDEAFA